MWRAIGRANAKSKIWQRNTIGSSTAAVMAQRARGTGRLKAFYQVIQQLVAEDKLLAYHDRSDGGLFATLAEMAFAGRCGLDIDLNLLLAQTFITTIPLCLNHCGLKR